MLSIIIPVLNEFESLDELHRQIVQVVQTHDIRYEIIFVDDGSTDQSWSSIEKIAQANSAVRAIRFRRNFGKAAALSAGIAASQGQHIMMLDADLQDDPAEIPAFIDKLATGFDVVNGWKQRRLDPWHKVYPSKVFNGMVGALSGLKLHDHNCGIKIFTSEVGKELQLYGEMHRFIPVLAHSRGYRVGEVAVHHRSRQFGSSKYGFKRFLRGFLDLLTVSFLTKFGQRPLHFLGGIGLFFFLIGLIGMGALGFSWLMMNVFDVWKHVPIGQRPLLIYSVASLLLGAQALSLGILAELIVANTRRDGDAYSVSQKIR